MYKVTIEGENLKEPVIVTEKVYKGFMCRNALVTDLGMCYDRPRPVEVYGTIEALKNGRDCWRECGIVEVEIKEIREITEKGGSWSMSM